MLKRLVIIPARGGSKRIKNKNLKVIKNKELISYSIDAVIKSNIFSKIHVSSDSLKILKFSQSKGIKTDFLRPKKISSDSAPLFPVIKFVVEEYRKKKIKFDQVWLVYATNPFISKKIILGCKNKFENQVGQNALMTVTRYNYPIEWAHKLKKNGHMTAVFPRKLNKRSQDLTPSYCDAGMINIYPSKLFYTDKKINYNFIPYILPMLESVDIDDMEDFKIAKKLLNKY